FVLITLILIRAKKFSLYGHHQKSGSNGQGAGGGGDSGSLDKKPSHLNLLKNSTSTVYPSGANSMYGGSVAALQQHLSMLGLDGIDKKPEIFFNHHNQYHSQV